MGRAGAARARPAKLLLIDYLSLLYRAFYSLPASVSVNGVHGFLSMLARLVTDRRPTALAVAIDEDWRPEFRVAELPTYKTHRVSDEVDPVMEQEEVGRDVLAALGVAVAGAPGYEAEDVIATLAARASCPVEIVSGDRDLFALVRDPDVRVLYPVKGVSTLVEVDEAEVTRRYGIPGRAYLDYAILRGDPSDGLPGVPGIGDKTASRLIATHGSLAGVLAARDLPATVRRRLDGAAAYLAAAVRVVAPVADAPVRAVGTHIPTKPPHPRRLAQLVATHELAVPVARLQTALASAAEASP